MSIIVNLGLAVFKLVAGILATSTAMISDAVHSASDVFSTIVVIIGLKISSKDADENHPYGHERYECVAAVVLAVVLFITGGVIGYNAIVALITRAYTSYQTPGLLALIAAVVSIAVKEGMYWYTRHYAKKERSTALMADAWHHRSDALSSIGALIGIVCARAGLLFMDSVAGIIICLFILKAAYDIFIDSIDKMVDKACDPEYEREMRTFVLAYPKVRRVDRLHTRSFGNRIYVDLEIALDKDLSLLEAHDIAEAVHDNIEEKYEDVKHVTVHVNPY